MAWSWSFNLCKPDCIVRGLVGKVITRFEEKGLSLVDLKWVRPTEQQVRAMYQDKQTYAIFAEILAYLVDQPVIAMVWAGEDASAKARLLIGEKQPLESEAGSIRGSMASDQVRNLVHGSRTDAEAYVEMQIFFPERWPGIPLPAVARPPADAPKELAGAATLLREWWSPPVQEATW
jgi:nucleoside-diphosphate kinase